MSMTADGWRPMTVADLPTVSAVAAAVHVDYPEDDAVFAERLALFPEGCRIAVRDGRAVGYAVLHPGRLGAPPPLNSLLGGLPADADCLYIHDVALLDAARGGGLGRALLAVALAAAARRRLPLLALTATPAAAGFWLGLGFADRPPTRQEAATLAGYGAGMRYMTRSAAAF